MTDEPENLTLKLLREMRAEMRDGFAELRGQIVEMKAEIVVGRLALIEQHTGLVKA